MTSLSKGLAALLFAIAVINAGHHTIEIFTTFRALFFEQDSTTHADEVFEPVRKELIEMGATQMGYRVAPGFTFNEKAAEYYVAQYSLAPVIIRPLKDDDQWVLMNYSPGRQPFPAPDLTCVQDFGWGLAIHKKTANVTSSEAPDLGRVWHEQEGPWMGTWTRRGLSNTFDAVWNTADGREAKDEITYESVNCHRIILYRKGTNGRYRGRLSADGTRIESGEADWFGLGDRWSATIDRSE